MLRNRCAGLGLLGAVLAAVVLAGTAFSGRPSEAATVPSPVIAAAGDIACDPQNPSFNGGNGSSNSCRQLHTSNLLVNAGLAAVLPLGDNQYYCGGYTAFTRSYDPSWGRLKAITHPVVGNHEYLTKGGSSGGTGCNSANADAAGYFSYFNGVGVADGRAGLRGRGYYSYDVGAWHLIALNSSCSRAGGCGTSSPQYQWLRDDLAAHPESCKLAYWHIPLFSSGGRAASNTKAFWDLLHAAGADVVLASHDHTYERFAPQRPDGRSDPNGIRQFIVGTGGANHTSFVTTAANSEVRNDDTYGVLLMTLHPTSYEWRFVPEAGKAFTDVGGAACHRPAPPRVEALSTDEQAGNRATRCGPRPLVQTLRDEAAARIDFRSRATSVKKLRRLRPRFASGDQRIAPTEMATYRIRARLRSMKLEADGDIRVVVSDRRKRARTMRIEFPPGRCLQAGRSPRKAAMLRARRALVRACGAPKRSARRLRGTASIVGVGFFHAARGHGAAPNGLQLTPVLKFRAPGCRIR